MSLQGNRKGVSVMIGYILLIVFAVVMGSIIFVWLKSYSPTEGLSCPDGTSFFIEKLNFSDATSKLTLTTRNNGRFDIAGYFIHASNNSSNDLQTIDLSSYLNQSSGGIIFGNSVIFGAGANLLGPGDQKTNVFDIPAGIGKPYSISLTPTRFQEENNRQRFASCGSSVISQVLNEPIICTPDSVSVTCGTWQCGNRVNNCGDLVSCPPGCSGGNICNSTGSCVPPSPNCGNGVINAGEACDDGGVVSGDGCSNICEVEGGWTCVGQPSTCQQGGAGGSFNSCGDYCDTFPGYSNQFSCQQNQNQCPPKVYIGNVPGANATYGDGLCTGGNADTCCCTPS